MKVLFSFVVDDSPVFAYQGYHLVHSILLHCGGEDTAIIANVTPPVTEETRALFRDLGCRVAEIEYFGDRTYCNKIAQIPNIEREDFDVAVLLDTDTILTADIRPYLREDCVQGKIVDMPSPSVAALREVASLAGMKELPPLAATDSGVDSTFRGNFNGGFYGVPREFVPMLLTEWPRWAGFLFEHIKLSRLDGMGHHVDQVSMWLAIQMNNLPYADAPSNLNYYVHFRGKHMYYKSEIPICMLHYHGKIGVLGLIDAACADVEAESAAICEANRQIERNFDSRVFWNFRYHQWPERGSGVGSRGGTLLYKRDLLKAEGIELANSVLDVGCGDLEVLRALELHRYVGLDSSIQALGKARSARPDWVFRQTQLDDDSIEPADFVLCMEVLPHQRTAGEYHRLIDFLARKTARKLIVSGYASPCDGSNHMTFYYEPLQASLERTGRFQEIRQIGAHTSVLVYRCLAGPASHLRKERN